MGDQIFCWTVQCLQLQTTMSTLKWTVKAEQHPSFSCRIRFLSNLLPEMGNHKLKTEQHFMTNQKLFQFLQSLTGKQKFSKLLQSLLHHVLFHHQPQHHAFQPPIIQRCHCIFNTSPKDSSSQTSKGFGILSLETWESVWFTARSKS